MGFDIEISRQEFTPHARMHHVVIIVIIVMLVLCYSMMSHAILILVCHTSMSTLQIFHVHFGCHKRDIMDFRVYTQVVSLGPYTTHKHSTF